MSQEALVWTERSNGSKMLQIKGAPGMLKVISALEGDEEDENGEKVKVLPPRQQLLLPKLYHPVSQLIKLLWEGGVLHYDKDPEPFDSKSQIDPLDLDAKSSLASRGHLILQGNNRDTFYVDYHAFLVSPMLVERLSYSINRTKGIDVSGVPRGFVDTCIRYIDSRFSPQEKNLIPVTPLSIAKQCFVGVIDQYNHIKDLEAQGLDTSPLYPTSILH